MTTTKEPKISTVEQAMTIIKRHGIIRVGFGIDLGAAGLFGIAGALERLESEKAKLLEALEALIGCRELNKFFDTRKYGVHYICRFCRTRYVEPMVICVNRDCPANKARAAIAEAERP